MSTSAKESARQTTTASLMPLVERMRAYQLDDWERTLARVDSGEPFVLADAKTPLEILRALDIPFAVNQWWSAHVSEAGEATNHLAGISDSGYPDNYAQYNLVSLGTVLARKHGKELAQRLPRPTIVVTENSLMATHKAMELWPMLAGVPTYSFHLGAGRLEAVDWWDRIQREWAEVVAVERLDLMEAQIGEFVALLEELTGRRLDLERLATVLDLVNEQEEYNARSRDLIAQSPLAPVGIADSIAFVMAHQWLRGTEWARDAARDFYLELERLSKTPTSAAFDQTRLLWIGNGLWHNSRYWERVEDRHQARFVWSIYLGIAADGYLRYGDDPLRTLAARWAPFADQLHSPPWNSRWYASEAVRNRVDGAINLNLRGSYFIERELEETGVPVLNLDMNPVDERTWDEHLVDERTDAFMEERVKPVAQRRLAGMGKYGASGS